MNAEDMKRGAQIAAALATMLVAPACGDDSDKVGSTESALVCVGGNECASMSECAGGPGGSECAGMNECKGMGWSYTETEEECEKAGGKVES